MPEKKTNAAARSIREEERSNVTKILEIEREQREHRSLGEKISEWIALFAGSMVFVYLHVIFFAGWILANTVITSKPFDPFPFTFLTLVVSLEAIFLSTFILVSQNHDTQLSERRNHLDLQINLLTEQENTKMLELLQAIAEKVGVDCADDAMLALLEPVEPKELVKEILDASGEEPIPDEKEES